MPIPENPPVPAVMSLVTLGVADLARATAFYRRLGWPVSDSSVPGVVTFLRTAGPIVALFPHQDLAADAGLPGTDPLPAYRGSAFAINVAGAEAVDAVVAAAVAAGATLVKAPVRTDWGGYSGYFADLDGHLWECAHNPAWPIGEHGVPVLPD